MSISPEDDTRAGTTGPEGLSAALAGRYMIECELGRGGMATVYGARDLRHRRQVAIKVMRGDIAAALGAERFLREIEIAAGLNHPHILPLYDSGDAAGLLHYVMPHVQGPSLRQKLARDGPLEIAEGLRILREIVDALAYAHQRGIVHRDIKPENVLMSGQHALVADFGIAKAVSAPAADSHLTTVGIALGTPAYMAPEQVTADPHVDHRADLYAVGALGYELLTGHPPFTRATRQQVLSAHVMDEPDPIERHRPDVPAAFARLITKCLKKKPDDRWQTADELLKEIDAVTFNTEPRSTAAARPWNASARHRLAAGALLLVAILAIAGGVRSWIIARSPTVTSDAGPRRFRIAVMPFDNLSTADDEFFTDGIARDINSRLAKVASFVVIAHGSVERLQREGTSYADIARRLNVDYLVDGGVTRAADRFRITVSLVDPSNDVQLWTDEYDREITISNLLAVRSDIAVKVAQALNLTLTPGERREAEATRSLDAYREHQLGRYFAAKRTVTSLRTARDHFERAIAIDPDYALAHAGLADVLVLLPFFSRNMPARDALARAAQAAERALQLDPSLGQAETALGLIREFQFNWAEAETHFRRGVTLTPQYATAHHWYADMLARQRRFPEALAEIQAALELDPVSPIINQDVGYVLTLAGKTEEGIAAFRRTVELEPGFVTTWMILGTALMTEGRFDEAGVALRRFAELSSLDSTAVTQLVDGAAAFARTGIRQAIPSVLLEESLPSGFASAHFLMLIGRHDEALALLEQGYEQGNPGVVMSAVSPVFRPLRTAPRFIALLEKAGLPQ